MKNSQTNVDGMVIESNSELVVINKQRDEAPEQPGLRLIPQASLHANSANNNKQTLQASRLAIKKLGDQSGRDSTLLEYFASVVCSSSVSAGYSFAQSRLCARRLLLVPTFKGPRPVQLSTQSSQTVTVLRAY